MRSRILKNNLELSVHQKEILTGLLLGDGCLERTKNSTGARLKVSQCFSKPDIERLISVLKEKFSLNSSIRTQKDGLQIYISAKSAVILNNLLKDKILPYFYYKLPIKV